MPTITRTGGGKVTAIWGGAQIRDEHGKMQPLHVGDLVKTGDVILTTQNGIVRISGEADLVAAPKPTQPSDSDRVISGLNQGDLDIAPGAGVLGGDGGGLWPGFRVDRITEGVTPASMRLPQYEESTVDDLPNEIRAEVLPLAEVPVEPPPAPPPPPPPPVEPPPPPPPPPPVEPSATVSLTASEVTEGPTASYTFTATLSAASKGVTTVVTNQGTITIEDGQTSGSIKVGVGSNGEDVYVDPSSLSAEIQSASGGNFQQINTGTGSATAYIKDTIDTTTVTLGTVVLDGKGNYYITASIDHAPETELTLQLSNGASVTFAANGPLNANSTLVPVPSVALGDPSLTVSVTSTNAGGNFENVQTAGTVTVPTLITADGLRAEYYGYNDAKAFDGQSLMAGYQSHRDDMTFGLNNQAFWEAKGNLERVEDVEQIISGRSISGNSLKVGEAQPDATFLATAIDFGLLASTPKPVVYDPETGRINDNDVSVRNSLGTNPSVSPDGDITAGNLHTFVGDSGTDLRAREGGLTSGGDSGLGRTTDAAIRFTGQAYFEAGLYDIRIYADDGFQLKLNGEVVAALNDIQPPTTRVFEGVALDGGLTGVELLYWEQAINAVLRVEFKLHGSEESAYRVLGTPDGIPLFSDPSLHLSDLQDLLQGTDPGTYVVRTGLELDGDNTANSLTGTVARDALMGFGGGDNLNGGDGNDRISGGQGDDFLTGGSGRDVFEWKLGDQGTTALPARDVIMDFNTDDYSGDVLDFRDMFGQSHTANSLSLPTGLGTDTKVTINADAGTLADYLHFTTNGTDTMISISSKGDGHVDQEITLNGVNLMGGFRDDQQVQVITDLLARGKILADVST